MKRSAGPHVHPGRHHTAAFEWGYHQGELANDTIPALFTELVYPGLGGDPAADAAWGFLGATVWWEWAAAGWMHQAEDELPHG